MPVYAESIFTPEGRQEHYEKALIKYNEPTKNPIKRVWRKVVLWDAENGVEIDKYTTQRQKEQAELEAAHAAYLNDHPEARIEEALDRQTNAIMWSNLINNTNNNYYHAPHTYHGYMHSNGAFEITRY